MYFKYKSALFVHLLFSSIDEKINKLVFELYGLGEEEIKIIV